MSEVSVEEVFGTEELLGYANAIFEWYKPYFGENSWTVEYASAIVEWLRNSGFVVLDLNGVPASPSVRGAEDIKTVARIYAFFDGEEVILPRHMKKAVLPSLRGKFFLNREAIARHLTHDQLIYMALNKVPVARARS
jgi:hypothetical protein